MIDRDKAYVGMPVIRKSDGKRIIIDAIDNHPDALKPYRLDENTRHCWHSGQELDPIDPPAPKRVEVVTETKTVVKEVVIRLPADMAKQIASVCGLPGWDEYSKQIHAAIAEQEEKS